VYANVYAATATLEGKMKSILKSLLAASVLAILTFAIMKPEAQGSIQVPKAPTAVFQGYKAIELPEDGVKYFTTVFLPDNYRESAQCRQILSWFQTEPRLATLVQTTHYATYTESDPMYQTRYKASVGQVPCVCVNDANGRTLFITRTFPNSGAEFADLISESVNSAQLAEGWRRDQRRQGVWNPNHRRGCPFPQPEPTPEPISVPEPPLVQPELVADTQPATNSHIVLAVIVAGVVGAGASLANEIKKEANRE
jgi:hypothetical protein